MKTSELTGAALDWAVAKCERLKGNVIEAVRVGELSPSTQWHWGGPIIEREKISTEEIQGAWKAELEILTADDAQYKYGLGHGPTPLIAAMRCYVASKLGDNIDIPKELT
jgi:hypothetical protein